MKIKFILHIALFAFLVFAPFAAITGEAKSKPTASVQNKQAFPNLLKIFDPILNLLNRTASYRGVEKNVFYAMPDKMPKEYKCPVNGSFIRVHALSPPTSAECGRVKAAYQRVIRNTTGNFAERNGFTPIEAFRGWTLFDQPKEYRVWFLEDEGKGRIAEAISPEVAGCPIIRTHNSSTGYASGITGGIKIAWGGEAKAYYPFVVVARLSPAQEARAECGAHQQTAWYNEFEHLRTLNKVKVNGRWHQSYLSFTGENDFHNIFKD